jgi:hypothetical protein
MAWMTRLNEAKVELARRSDDPWKEAVKRALPGGVTSISTVTLLDLLNIPSTSGNARRVAACMRALGFVPLKSRRLFPGGFRGTTIRGWARTARDQGGLKHVTAS